MDENEIKTMLAEAEAHFTRYEWDEALACFEAVLEVAPNHGAAVQGKRETLAKKAADAQIKEIIANAREALEAGRYAAALTALDQAQSLGAQNHILHHHAAIDGLRDAAQERQRRQVRVIEDMAQAKRLEEGEALDQALDVLNTLLRDLAASGLDDLGEAARQERDRLQASKDLNERIDDADRAWQEQDYRHAAELAEELYQQFPRNPRVRKAYDRATGTWNAFQQQLTGAREMLADGRLDDAVAILSKLRQQAPRNPDWQALWLKAYMDHGRAQTEAGRQAVQNHAFDDARPAFETARDAFQAATEVFAEHPSAGLARDEAAALYHVAVHATQAQRDRQARRWEPARQALLAARDKLAEAVEARRRDFSEVAAVLNGLLGEVGDSVEKIAEAKALLTEGNDLLADREPDQAEARFRRGMELAETRDEDLNRSLLDGLRKADRIQQDVKRLLEKAQESEDDAQRLGFLQSVYEQWPAAPGMPALLVDTLLEVAEQSLNAGEEGQAAAWLQQVLNIGEATPDKQAEARQKLEALDRKHKVEGALKEAKRLQAELDRATLPTAEGYQQLVDVLLRAQEQARGYPDMQPPVEQRLQKAQARWQRLSQAEPLIGRAEDLRQQGEWAEAASRMGEAVAALGDDLPVSELRQRWQTWQGIAEAVSSALEQAQEALAQASEHYLAARDGDLAAVQWAELKRTLTLAESTLSTRPVGAEPLPKAWNELQAKVEDLQARGKVLGAAFDEVQAGRPMQALPILSAAVTQRPDDHVLAAVRVRLQRETAAEAQEKANRLLAEAREHAERVELTDALEKLAEARRLGGDWPEISAELQRLERQFASWDKMQRLNLDGLTKRRSDSPEEALTAFREAIRTAIDADSGLPEEVRGQLGSLLTLERRLHQDHAYRQGEEFCDALVKAAAENRLIQNYLVSPVRSWFEVASHKARVGFISSQMALEKHEEAYAEAVKALATQPEDRVAMEMAAEARSSIQAQLLGSAQKRLGRAKELRDKGAFAEALAELDRIESEFLARIRERFPEVVQNVASLEEVSDEADDLRLDLKSLQEVASRLEPLLGEIRQAYTEGTEETLREAGRKIAEAEVADPTRRARLLWEEMQSLQELIQRRRQGAARERVRGALAVAETGLDLSDSAEGTAVLIRQLGDLRDEVHQLEGPEGESLRQRFTQVMARAQTRLEELQSVTYALATAQEAAGENRLEEQLAAYQRAAAIARGSELERIKAEVERLRPQVERQRRMNQAWEEALEAYELGDFDTARQRLVKAKLQGKPEAVVEPYQQAARAGQLLKQAQLIRRDDPLAARSLLKQALAQTADGATAETLRQEIVGCLEQIDREEEQRQSVAGQLRAAESAFRQSQFDEAQNKLDDIFELLPDHSEAKRLQEKLDKAIHANTLLGEAHKLRDEEQYDSALGLVNQALELHPELVQAQRLQAQLQAEAEAGKALANARSLAKEHRFAEARAALAEAREKNPNHPRLAEVQDELQTLEDRFRDKALRPASEALRKKDYRTALREYAALLTQAGSPDFRAEVQQLQQSVVDEWASNIADRTQANLKQRDVTLDDLLRLRSEMRDVLDATPGPAARRAETLRDLIQQIETERLRQRLAEGQQALDRGELPLAAAIGAEVERDAQSLELLPMMIEAGNFNLAVERRQEEETKAARDATMAEARQRLNEASDMAGLEAARHLADEVLARPGYGQDVEALQLRDNVDGETERFRTTSEALGLARKRLNRRAYRRAQEGLQEIEEPSRLLRHEVGELLRLARDLQSAEDSETADPEVALAVYLRAVQDEPDLTLSLEQSINRCRMALLDQAIIQVEESLDAAIPDHEAALARLQAAEDKGWVTTPDGERQVENLRARAQGLALTAQAAQVLTAGGDPQEALRLLEEARAQATEGRLDPLSVGWEAVARIKQASHEGDLAKARTWGARVPDALKGEDFVQKLLADLEARTALAAALEQAEEDVRAALGAHDPDFDLAVKEARRAWELSDPPPERARALVGTVRDRLVAAIARLRNQEDYAHVPPLLGHLRALLSGDSQPDELQAEIEQERLDRLDEALKLAESALANDGLEEVRRQLERARKLAGEAGDTRIEPLRQRLAKRAEELRQANADVDQARAALSRQDLEAAVDHAIAARSLAPRYDRVVQCIAELRSHFQEQVNSRLAAERYAEALEACDQALRLGAEPPFPELRGQVLARRRQATDEAYKRARAALVIFDLAEAEAALAAGRKADEGDDRFAELERLLRQAQTLVAEVRQSMEDGWSRLQAHDFPQAQATFQTLASKLRDFTEPGSWQRYTSSLIDGVSLGEREQHEAAARCFEGAEKSLRVRPHERLSPLWGDRLETERRRAVYYAWRLRQEVEGMASQRQRARDLNESGDVLGALEVMRKLTDRQRRFLDLVKTAMEPPVSFDASALHHEPASPPAAQAAEPSVLPLEESAPVDEGETAAVPAASEPRPELRPDVIPEDAELHVVPELQEPQPPAPPPESLPPEERPEEAPATEPADASGDVAIGWDDWFGGQTLTTPMEED